MSGVARGLAVIVLLAGAAFFMGEYHNDVYRKLLLWVTLALGYNFLFGICGQVAFSHFAFYGIGAYSIVIFLFQVHLPLLIMSEWPGWSPTSSACCSSDFPHCTVPEILRISALCFFATAI